MELHVTDMQQFGRCRIKWFFSSTHGLGLRPNVTPPALFLGSIFHAAVEGWNKSLVIDPYQFNEALVRGRLMLHLAASEYDDPFSSEIELALTMFENWCLWAKGKWSVDKVTDIEKRFKVRIPTPNGGRSLGLLAGKVDALVNYNGAQWLLELKTAKSGFRGYTVDLEIDLQMAAYVWAFKKLGHNIKGIFRVTAYKTVPSEPKILKSGTRLSKQKITTTPELLLSAINRHGLDVADYTEWLEDLESSDHPCFDIKPFQYSNSELEATASRLYTIYREMKKGVIYANPTRLCSWCAFSQACKLGHKGLDYGHILEEEFHKYERH